MDEKLIEGLSTMIIGMGTVFIFLCIMIFAMHIMSAAVRVLNKFFPEAVPVTASRRHASSGDDSEIAAAIVAAMFKGKK